MRYTKFIVTLVILMNAAFTTAVLFIFYRVCMEPTALIAAWFGFTTVELWALAGIKKKELEEEHKCKETSGPDSRAGSFY